MQVEDVVITPAQYAELAHALAGVVIEKEKLKEALKGIVKVASVYEYDDPVMQAILESANAALGGI